MSSPSSATKPRRSPCSATVLADIGDVQVPYETTVATRSKHSSARQDDARDGTRDCANRCTEHQAVQLAAQRFFDAFRPPVRDPLFFGTFAPASLASDRPIAIACLRLVTRLPERPLFKVPLLRSRIARSTFCPAFLPYSAMRTLHTRACLMRDPCRTTEPRTTEPRTYEPSRMMRPASMSHVTLPIARRVWSRRPSANWMNR